MNTKNEISTGPGQTDQPLAEASSAHGIEPQSNKAKTGIGGCLLFPLLVLVAQPILFIYMLATARSSPWPMTTYRIFWPYMIYDLTLLGGVVILLMLFMQKKAILPAMFILFLVTFAILSGLVTNLFWRLPDARVTGRDPLLSHFALLLQNVILIPYFALDFRVKNTFVHELDDRNPATQLTKPIVTFAERLYGWLVRRGKMVFLYTWIFVILVFLFDWAVDSIVLNVFL